jgi:signal transduction histidine kinase
LAELDVRTFLDAVLMYTENQEEWKPYRFTIDVEDKLPAIAADENLCRQVFLNLLINARDAMPEGGEIRLRGYRKAQKQVALEVIDQGMGIHPEQMDQIFDPFYTSKEEGTGLGLSLVHQIIASHNGEIQVDSKPGEGSVFRLLFPTYQAVHPDHEMKMAE